MYIPIIRKIINRNNHFIERTLPAEGDLNVKVGDTVEPFDQIGSCRVSYEIIKLGTDFTPNKSISLNKAVFKGQEIGKVKRNTIYAPFDGFLTQNSYDGAYKFNQTTKDFALLSSVWGNVTDIVPNKSVLIKTNFKDIVLPVASGSEFSGELVVFPNPSELLINSFIEKFTKDMSGKIFYIGGHISLSTIIKAKELNLKVLLAGSITKKAYAYAKENSISIGLFEGYGDLHTSRIIFNELKNISNRYVFYYPSQNLLRIPVPHKMEHKKIKSPLKLLKEGDLVQIFQDPYFGTIATVDTIKESSIFVKIPKNSKLIKVNIPNFFVVE